MAAITLPGPIQRRIETTASAFLTPRGLPVVDFRSPPGEAALVDADSVSWLVFKNPISLFIGGVAAVILELAEPRVRAGVWGHTSFRDDPVDRLQRTGLAAMVTVYAARSVAEAMIAGIGRRHARIAGVSEHGQPYSATDPELLDWVQATASYGFLEAYHRFVRPLPQADRDRFYAEAVPAARLYGAVGAPTGEADWREQFAAMLPKLEASPIVFEFLDIVSRAPALPILARPLQGPLVRAAVTLVPDAARKRLGLDHRYGLSAWQAAIVRAASQAADRLLIQTAPPAQASLRMGRSADWLYRR
ncbi:MAG TPA: oxygenase MpaB family protein [Arsenicitalea sp.]|jgi:uncharacterized protein (DUF2236 family)|nr:oxygenase MpaB family protein [Arsenicitalea sp.]